VNTDTILTRGCSVFPLGGTAGEGIGLHDDPFLVLDVLHIGKPFAPEEVFGHILRRHAETRTAV